MNVRLVYQIHKWLALVVSVATLGWFLSGALMAMPGGTFLLTRGLDVSDVAEARLPGAPPFEAARMLPSDAVAAIRTQTGRDVHVISVELRRLPDHLVYDIVSGGGQRHLVDAESGAPVVVDEVLARRIVARFLGSETGLGSASVIRERPMWYIGAVPVYAVPLEGSKGTIFYVDPASGHIRMTDRLSRPVAVLQRLHSLGFLALVIPRGSWVIVGGLASLGLLMALAGVAILISQFMRWRKSPNVSRR